MRLHRLTVSAFGPFPGTEVVDFDELNDAGLFLLTGPTGAGKTSILDAICFALYGAVPGARGVKTLKSQHAAADARPEVALDFSIAARRFVLRRTPEWSRPKLRGAGTTEEKSSATLIEMTTGEEHFLSSRAQEVGHLVSGLIGMSSVQFAQVAMLPQGEFARFLRATSQERHDVLQHLFKTDRFTRIEEWVTDHTRQLGERAKSGQSDVQRILDTMADRAGVELPEELSGASLTVAAVGDQVLSWARQASEAAAAQLTAARARHEQARAALTTARTDHDAAIALTDRIARRDRARMALAELAAGADAEATARAALDRDARASSCRPVLELLDSAAAAHALAATDRYRALARISAHRPVEQGPANAETLAALAHDTRTRITLLEALLPRETELVAARAELAEAEEEVDRFRADIAVHAVRRDQIPTEVQALTATITRTAELARRKEVTTAELAIARGQLEAARQLPEWERAQTTAADLVRDARDRAGDAREHMHDVVARRLTGIAAELAGRLRPDEACQVCGSVEHPRPATPSADAVSEQVQQEAAARYDALHLAAQQAQQQLAEVTRRTDSLRQAAGGLGVEEALQRESELVAAVSAAEQAEREQLAARAALDRLTVEATEVSDRLHQLETRCAEAGHLIEVRRRTIETVTAEITRALGSGRPGDSLPDALAAATETLADLDQATAALAAHDRAATLATQYTSQAEAMVAQHDFASIQDAHLAGLSSGERDRLERFLQDRSEIRNRANVILEEAGSEPSAELVPPDLPLVREALDVAELTEAEAARVYHQQQQVAESLRGNLLRLERALAEWAPVRDQYLNAEAMSKLIRGTGGDNHLQMRLSAYVLATRLDQVVAAANERLSRMRDQRYLLERTGKASRRNAQAGLGLQIVDEWTGDVRDPATLSGGETFVVSLALALGLADVVTQEAGGVDIETLFVDEGFGMLDPDTLDDVMDRLDDLRAGGRTVGVVSHVSEMRDRIPTQVHVEKSRSGSTVSVRTLVG